MRTLRALVGLLGELLITLGLVLLLFVGWQLVWTDLVSDADADNVVNSLQQQFERTGTSAAPGADGGAATPSGDPNSTSLSGSAYAIVRIPRFGASFARPLYEGTSRDVLMRGIGHYAGTDEPGQVGNFAMAGHRTTYGKPFNLIDELKVGDGVVVETRDSYFVYRITGTQIVAPTQSSVLLPVPNAPDATATRATLTMTSCHPEFSARERYVAFGVLAATYPHAEGLPADALKVG